MFESEQREGTLKLSAGIGHVVLDAAYAADDAVKAAEALKDAKENLSKMKNLRDQGKADDEAVRDAQINVTLAGLNVVLAGLKVAAAAEKAQKTSDSWGFYADLQLTRTGQKTNTTANTQEEVASQILAQNNILINSGLALTATTEDQGNTNIKGSITSNSGDITITSANDTNITAVKSTSTSTTKSEGFSQTVTLASSAGQSSSESLMQYLSAQIGVNKSNADSTNTTYTNSAITAKNGSLDITSLDNASIKGANLLAQDITINTGNNLNIESLQNHTAEKSKSTSVNGGGGANSVSFGFNYESSKFNRDWVDDQTDVIGTNSVNINTINNTNLNGSLIANIVNPDANQEDRIDGGNLTLDTGSLTYQDIIDKEKQQTVGYGLQATIALLKSSQSNDKKKGPAPAVNSNSKNPNQDAGYYPQGSTTLSMKNEGYEKEGVTRATIGEGDININGQTIEQIIAANQGDPLASLNRDVTKSQEVTKDVITDALDINTTIDLRLLSEEGRKAIFKEVKHLPGNTILIVADVLTAAKNLFTSFGDVNPSDPKNDSYFKVLSNKVETKRNVVLNPQFLLKAGEDANYFLDYKNMRTGYYDPSTGKININLAYNQTSGDLMETTLHETYHKENDYSGEEVGAENYASKTTNQIDFYHNLGDETDNAFSKLISWSYSNSAVSDQYDAGNEYVRDYGNIATANVTTSSILYNNQQAANADPSKIESEIITPEHARLLNLAGQRAGEEMSKNPEESLNLILNIIDLSTSLAHPPGVVSGLGRSLIKSYLRNKAEGEVTQITSNTKNWLEYHENVNGGHTIEKHVGKSDEFLIDRVTNPTKYNPNQKTIKGASSYTDIETAQNVISDTINQNRSEIQKWLRNGDSNKITFNYEGMTTIGRGLDKGSTVVTNRTNAITILKKDDKGSFTILTSYPK